MKDPILVIMAAGMGSRYGGLKQMDPMDDEGNFIIDYSLFDAYRAGFRKVVFVIKEENREDFESTVGSRARKRMEVEYAYQSLSNIPEGYAVPADRQKPWGTAHALYSAKDFIEGPFAIINADDYYGVDAFKEIYNYLSTHEDRDVYSYVMVGYKIQNTLTEQGSVARGVTSISDGNLSGIVERTNIKRVDGKIAFSEDGGETWEDIKEDTIVSMNMWGFTKSIVDEIEKAFPDFLEKNLKSNPLKCEYFLPFAVEELLEAKKAKVRVLTSSDRWYGVTYKEDKPVVIQAFKDMKIKGVYPESLWEDA